MTKLPHVRIEDGSIPPFTHSGVLPPFVGSEPSISSNMSPYRTSMSQLVIRYGTTSWRREILAGLIGYRNLLRSFGFIDGYQWVDGSFVEKIEREPKDIDVVCVVHRPRGYEDDNAFNGFYKRNRLLFSQIYIKARFNCDAYYIDLNTPPISIVDKTRYWFGLFSHRRDNYIWKGMLRLDLNEPDDDDAAMQMILEQVNE